MPLPKVAVDPSAMGFGGGQAPPPMSLVHLLHQGWRLSIAETPLQFVLTCLSLPPFGCPVQRVFKKYDKDGSGQIDFKELRHVRLPWGAYNLSFSSTMRVMIVSCFCEAGNLTLRWLQLCYDMGHPLTDEQIETARHVLDADGNGVLSCGCPRNQQQSI